MRICNIEGCGGKHEARGLCNTHYQVAYKAGALPPKVEKPEFCSVAGCDRKAKTFGMCNRHYRKEWRATRPEIEREQQATRRAANPERHREYSNVFYARHTEKLKAKTRAFNGANPEYQTQWRRENPDKLQEYDAARRNLEALVDDGGIRAAFRGGMPERRCAQCGADGPSEVDHIIPLAWVKTHPEVALLLAEAWCYQPLCRSCNASKSTNLYCFVATGDIG